MVVEFEKEQQKSIGSNAPVSDNIQIPNDFSISSKDKYSLIEPRKSNRIKIKPPIHYNEWNITNVYMIRAESI